LNGRNLEVQYCTFGLEAADDAQNVRVLGRHLAEMITTSKIHQNEKKTLGGDTNTALAVVRRSQKFRLAADPFPGSRDGQNLISWRWSLPSPTYPVW